MQLAVPEAVTRSAHEWSDEGTAKGGMQAPATPGGNMLCTMRSASALRGDEKSGHPESTYEVQPADDVHRGTASSSHVIISRRVLQFSRLAEAISSADDARLAELALQLHTPLAKLRHWEAHWKRISGQMQQGEAAAASNTRATDHIQDRHAMDAIEARDEPMGAHGEWKRGNRREP